MLKRLIRSDEKGSTLLLTLFTIFALITIGTTFIAISLSESKQSRGDKDLQLARQVALFGINWASSYMAVPQAWTAPNILTRQGSDVLYVLQPDTASNSVEWMGRNLDFAVPVGGNPQSDGSYVYNLGIFAPRSSYAATEVALSNNATEIGVMAISVTALSTTAAGQTYLATQPPQYAVTCTGYIFPMADAANPYVNLNGVLVPNAANAVAIRAITWRIRPQNPLDFAVFESNMRSWNIPGFNTQFGTNAILDNGVGTIQNNSQQGELESQLLQNMYKQVQFDSVGIPVNYQMKGNFRVDGSVTPGDPFAAASGSIHVFAQNNAQLSTISFSGNQTSFAPWANPGASPNPAYPGYLSNTFDGGSAQNQAAIFNSPNGATYNANQGLPTVAGYMNSYVADVTNANGTNSAPISAQPGWAASVAQSGSGLGYIKISTPPGGPTVVNSSTVTGSNVEIQDPNDPSTPAIQTPGVARVEITFNADDTVTVQKVGAYSGLPIDSGTPPFNAPVPISQLTDGLIYVDGGNVEIQGQVPSQVTVIASASTDRPTVATPAVEQDGSLQPQPGLPILITPQQQSSGQFPNTIYRDGADSIFNHDPTTGQITNIPAWDPSTQQWYFPAYDPTTVGTYSGNPSAVTSDAPLVREGNVSIVGNLTNAPSASNASLGIVAQNYILLSDQNPNGTSMTVDGALMSLSQSVQYGGFLTASGTAGNNDYYQAMAANPSNGTLKGSIPTPANAGLTNGTFTLNGSIIGQYADVESAQTGVGYTNQKLNENTALSNNLPPMFPNFSRGTQLSPVVWVVVATSDSAGLKVGTVATATP